MKGAVEGFCPANYSVRPGPVPVPKSRTAADVVSMSSVNVFKGKTEEWWRGMILLSRLTRCVVVSFLQLSSLRSIECCKKSWERREWVGRILKCT